MLISLQRDMSITNYNDKALSVLVKALPSLILEKLPPETETRTHKVKTPIPRRANS